jgi:hypothetical protein
VLLAKKYAQYTIVNFLPLPGQDGTVFTRSNPGVLVAWRAFDAVWKSRYGHRGALPNRNRRTHVLHTFPGQMITGTRDDPRKHARGHKRDERVLEAEGDSDHEHDASNPPYQSRKEDVEGSEGGILAAGWMNFRDLDGYRTFLQTREGGPPTNELAPEGQEGVLTDAEFTQFIEEQAAESAQEQKEIGKRNLKKPRLRLGGDASTEGDEAGAAY